jgi:uncharacterized protein (DUF1778 family)
MAKSHQLQIRVSAGQKAALRRQARRAGLDMSTYVLTRALPASAVRVAELIAALADADPPRFPLAELNDVLNGLAASAYPQAVEGVDVDRLSPYLQNYVTAMVEHAAHQKGVSPPEWARDVEPLEAPAFAVPFPRLRTYLLRSSPVAFKRRNLFVDATVGDRV